MPVLKNNKFFMPVQALINGLAKNTVLTQREKRSIAIIIQSLYIRGNCLMFDKEAYFYKTKTSNCSFDETNTILK
jgi:hypothetical protein